MSIKPRLNRLDLTMIVISLVIGMGIFATPSDTAKEVGNEWVFLGAWLFGGLVSLCGAGDCDQASMTRPAQITNVKRRTLAALFRRRVISRPGIHP